MSDKSTNCEASAIPDLRLVSVGLSGVGKSAAGNLILSRKEFTSGVSCSSLTLKSEVRQGEVCGKRVTVVDTPGLFNTELSGERLREEMKRSVSLCEPGPHAFLLVVQLGRFTEQEKRVMENLQQLFSKRVNQYTMVLFSYGDRLEDTPIEEFISYDTNLQKLLEKCGGRYHVFNNKDLGNTDQVKNLFDKIDNMVLKNKPSFFEQREEGFCQSLAFFLVGSLVVAAAVGLSGGVIGEVAIGGLSGGVIGAVIGLVVGCAGGEVWRRLRNREKRRKFS